MKVKHHVGCIPAGYLVRDGDLQIKTYGKPSMEFTEDEVIKMDKRLVGDIKRAISKLKVIEMAEQKQEVKPCANCSTEKPVEEMQVCMDSRQMHRYVCDTKCMVELYK